MRLPAADGLVGFHGCIHLLSCILPSNLTNPAGASEFPGRGFGCNSGYGCARATLPLAGTAIFAANRLAGTTVKVRALSILTLPSSGTAYVRSKLRPGL